MKIHSTIKEMIINKKAYIYLLITLCIGVLFMILGNSDYKNKTENVMHVTGENINFTEENNNFDSMEYKLINILKKVEGVGEIDIIINYTSTTEKIPLIETSGQSDKKIVHITDGAKSEPYIRTELNPDIEGVVIVAQGGDNINTVNILRTAVSGYLGVPVHKINVLKMK